MDNPRLVKISKYLSKHLRHQPEQIGLVLGVGGWVSVEELLSACEKHSFPITRLELDEVVVNNDKKRFSFDATNTQIRANQGHSIEIDLQLEPAIPPAILYHGTSDQVVPSILDQGIGKMSRHHVHLSTEISIARNVGARHGRPVVFAVDTAKMHQDGYIFYCSDNGVWLVDHVPAEYLQKIDLI